MALRIGAVTIGQAPRVDITPDLKALLGPEVELVEAGALDGLSMDQIAAMAPEAGDYVLATRLADGTAVQISERTVEPLLRGKITGLFEAGIATVLLLCTGEFPNFPDQGLLLRPQRMLFNAVAAVAEGRKLGVMMPSSDQLEQSQSRWKRLSDQVMSVGASPYVHPEESIPKAAEQLVAWGADVAIMDCMGYSLAMKAQVRSILGKPVILGRSVAARMLAELI